MAHRLLSLEIKLDSLEIDWERLGIIFADPICVVELEASEILAHAGSRPGDFDESDSGGIAQTDFLFKGDAANSQRECGAGFGEG